MFIRIFRAPAVWLAAGLAAGLAIGFFWPQAPLHAVATDRVESFAICTGMADVGHEAIFTLDFLTGDLSGAVINPTTRQFSALYKRNIMNDLKVETGKNPKFVICTGQVDLRPIGNVQWGACCVYVAEVTTGIMGVYSFPYNPSLTNNNRGGAVAAQFELLQAVPIRNATVREQ
ncbi:MAG TPA: hypothetical protein VHZ24_20890 [Pirellulales bacterium]|jgi:hypothetical protein|nr:hypothetical protein [Pirellulales bacterium]